MKKSYKNGKALALEILRGQWLINDATGNLLEAAKSFLSREKKYVTDEDEKTCFRLVNIAGDSFALDSNNDSLPKDEQFVLIVPVWGCLTKYDNCIGTATMELVDILEKYRHDDTICGFILDIDSCGGSVDAVQPLLAEIRKIQADGKPIISHVDECFSAAYWIASQTDAIFMDNILSSVGSIGAYSEITDFRENKQTGERIIQVYAPQSTEKNRAYRDALDGKFEKLEQKLSALVNVFIEDVKAGRPDLKADAEGVLSGDTFETAKAVELGMANGQADLSDCVEIVYVRANS